MRPDCQRLEPVVNVRNDLAARRRRGAAAAIRRAAPGSAHEHDLGGSSGGARRPDDHRRTVGVAAGGWSPSSCWQRWARRQRSRGRRRGVSTSARRAAATRGRASPRHPPSGHRFDRGSRRRVGGESSQHGQRRRTTSADDAMAGTGRPVVRSGWGPAPSSGLVGPRWHCGWPICRPDSPRLRACQAPGCVLYFVKDHPRREWCSTACGNRARAARHYRRHRDHAETPVTYPAPHHFSAS
jgi:hypothetical protein